jgi:hypothetical protein
MSNGDNLLGTRRTNATDGPSDPYDHAISLLDTTLPQTDPADASRSSSPNKLAKRTTVTSVREHLAKRKYAKWQQERLSYKGQQKNADDGAIQQKSLISPTEPSQMVTAEGGDKNSEIETTDFAPQPETSDRGRKRSPNKENKPKHKHREQPYEVDILYENQRGLFFFGIPLYSHSSLLNFDPAPWVTKDLKDSAVSIMNAQVPDPSWKWAWKSWYVDMSYDVDEEGWQYSFSFGKKWVWHGTHPWFHSYVRRRRWLRKRVKHHGATVINGDGGMHAAHVLTGDYFTIHRKRNRSPTSTIASTARASNTGQLTDIDDPPDTIENISNLLRVVRLATIDREKLDAVKKFLEQGGEELAYLEDQIPDIMSLFVFQTSRRQLVELLQREAAAAQKHRDEHDAEDRPEGETESRRIDNVLKAMRTANGQIGGLEYWSDRKHVLQLSDETGSKAKPKSDLTTLDGASFALTEDDPVEEVKGIPEKAELEVDHTHSAVDTEHSRESATEIEDKGKGKAKKTAEDEKDGGYKSFNVREPSDRIPTDIVLVPDEETGGD